MSKTLSIILALPFFFFLRLPFGLLGIALVTLVKGGAYIEDFFTYCLNPIEKRIYDLGQWRKK